MTSFDKVLVCLDQSEIDQTIIKNTCEFSKVAGTKEIIFINVIRDFNLPESLVKEFPDLLDKALAERKSEINNSVKEYFECTNIKTSVLILQGEATKEILTISSKEKVDLIILGRKKTHDSVLSTRIARRAACNLLLIPENCTLKFDKIHVPVDFSNYSDLSIRAALKLTEDGPASIYLQNVYHVPSSYRYSGKTYEEFAEIMEKNASKDLNILTNKVKLSGQKLLPVFSLGDGLNVMKLVFDEAKNEGVDMIVMGAKGRTAASALFIGSKAERMIHINNEIPLLVIRKKAANAGILESLQEI